MLAFWKRRREQAALVKADAAAMIAQFGERAYAEARLRTHERFDGSVIDGNRSEGHWDRVQAEIARVTGRRDRVDTATPSF
jgi:hypothetical protein